jgi:hypothetical protein
VLSFLVLERASPPRCQRCFEVVIGAFWMVESPVSEIDSYDWVQSRTDLKLISVYVILP